MIPNKIKIGGITYNVSTNKDDYLNGADLLGEISYTDQTLFVRSGLGKERQYNTFIHEVVHGILYEMGHKDYNDESLVKPLANILYQVIKDNKLVFNGYSVPLINNNYF
jgi:hypothetical protein